MLKYTPAVFAVEKNYQIMVPVTKASLFWVEVDGKCFYDEQNGIMRSLCTTHRVTVPSEVLDSAGEYTVCERVIIDRKPYFPETEDTVKTIFSFKPLPKDNIRIYHVADTHNQVDAPVRAAQTFGNIDLLVMNGDIPNHSGDIANFETIYEIAEKITHGSIPIIFARGNHDLRGYHAEEIAEYSPNHNGNTYYSFRVGNVWGLVLDCGEDKVDSYIDYGYTVACHGFRERQIQFIRDIIANSAQEYEAEGVMYKFIISHAPFTYQGKLPFNIEKEIYTEWAKLIKENISPDLMICGHMHGLAISPMGGSFDHLGQPCKLVIGADVGDSYHAGCGLTLEQGKEIQIKFCDSNGMSGNENFTVLRNGETLCEKFLKQLSPG